MATPKKLGGAKQPFSSITGQKVTYEYAISHPKTTVIPRPKKGK